MHPHWMFPWPLARSVLLGLSLILSTQTGRMAAQSTGTNQPVVRVVSVAVSTATRHVFAVSLSGDGKSWATMLDGRTAKVLRETALSNYSKMVTVDDPTHHAFVTSAGPPTTGGRLAVTMLNTRTGQIVRSFDCGASTGLWQDTAKARRSDLLIVVAPDALHLISLMSGGQVGVIAMASSAAEVAIHDSTGRLLVADASGQVSVYDARTGALVGTRQLSMPVSSYTVTVPVVRKYGSVPVITGTDQNTVTMLDPRTGKRAWSLAIPRARGNITAFPMDEFAGRMFAISLGNYWDPNGPSPTLFSHIGKGVVATIDLKAHRIVRTVKVGSSMYHAAIDPATHHLFVLSMAGFTETGAPIKRSTVTMIDETTGNVSRTVPVPYMEYYSTPGNVVVDSADSRAYVTTNMESPSDENTITVLNTRTGAVLPAIRLPSDLGTQQPRFSTRQ